MIKVDLSGAESFFDASGPDYAAAAAAHRALADKTGLGHEFTGWLELPTRIRAKEMKTILNAAKKIRELGQVLLVVGIGGSCLGARAAIELLRTPSYNRTPGATEVYFMGNTLSPTAISELVNIIGDRDFCVNVISKSGGTLEPALSFRVAREMLERKYGLSNAKKHIFVTTDSSTGRLYDLSKKDGFSLFAVPDDVGGRFSVLSAVGLLPMAVAGIDIEAILDCAIVQFQNLDQRSPENPAWQYAAARQSLYGLGKSIEILACYEPHFRYMAEWWKLLFGESEGKNGIGIYPATVEYSADLHSMGQFIQEGPRTLMETMVTFETPLNHFKIPFALGDPDGYNYLAGRDFSEVLNISAQAVRDAHVAGGVPCIVITAPACDEAGFASLVCFFEMSCAISAYMSGVNPFDQPGVEAYRNNLHRMLENA